MASKICLVPGASQLQIRSHRNGFTIIELLVSISIIVLLAAFLMPAFAEARRWSRLVSCQSNMRQLGMMYGMYESDCRDYLPAPGTPHRWNLWAASDITSAGNIYFNLSLNFEPTIAFITTNGISTCPSGAPRAYPNVLGWFYSMQYIPTILDRPGTYTTTAQYQARAMATDLGAMNCPDAQYYVDGTPARYPSRAQYINGRYNAYAIFSNWFASNTVDTSAAPIANPTGVSARDCQTATVYAGYAGRGWALNITAADITAATTKGYGKTCLRARVSDWPSNKGVLVDYEYSNSAFGGAAWVDHHGDGLNMLRADGSATFTGKNLVGPTVTGTFGTPPAIYYNSGNATSSALTNPTNLTNLGRLWNYYETGNQ